MSLRDFPVLSQMIGGFVKIVFSKGWLCIRVQCSINICFKFLTAGWYVVTKGNKHSWPFGFCVREKADCLEAKLTSDRDLSIMFSGYPLALRPCLNFKRPSSNFPFEELVLGNLIASPLMKPYFTMRRNAQFGRSRWDYNQFWSLRWNLSSLHAVVSRKVI